MRCLAVLLFGALALCAQDNNVVAGSVVNSATGAGIDGATVALSSQKGERNEAAYRAVTDASGRFRIDGVKLGEYMPRARKPGFFAPISTTFGQSIHIGAGDDTPPLRLELIPPGRVRGRVIGIDGKPAANVEVATGNQYTFTAKTNEDGDFVFDNLQPGSYSLMTRVKNVRTYFPATTNPALAEVIDLSGGADLSGYEIRLQPPPTTFRVRGVVLDAAGKPAPKTVIDVLPVSDVDSTGGFLSIFSGTTTFSISSLPAGAVPEREDPALTSAGGVFEFPALTEGDWIFRAESEDLVHAVARVGVRQDIDDLKIHLESPFDLSGTVALTDGTTPEDVTILVRLNSLDGTPGLVATSAKGALNLKGVTAGTFRIHAGMLSGSRYYVASVSVGSADVTDQFVPLNAASPPIRVVLKLGSTVTGTVEKCAGASVLLVPQTLANGQNGWFRECGAGGSFEFAGIPPGQYYAIAILGVDMRGLQTFADPEHLRVLTRDATSVRVDEGAVASVQLKAPQ